VDYARHEQNTSSRYYVSMKLFFWFREYRLHVTKQENIKLDCRLHFKEPLKNNMF